MGTALDTIIEEEMKFRGRVQELMDKKLDMDHPEVKRWVSRFDDLAKQIQDLRRSQVANMDDWGRIQVPRGKFAGLTPLELYLMEKLIMGRVNNNIALLKSETMEALMEAKKAIKQGLNEASLEKWQERMMRTRGVMSGLEMHSPGGMKFRDSLDLWRGEIYRQLRKALDSTTAGSGDELVPTLEAAELWMDVNLETKVLPLLAQFPMPSSPFDYPTQFGDINWYPTSENVAATSTTPTTGKSTLTAYELKGGVPFSDTLEEDAVIALAPELRRNMARNAAEVLDDILLNGDTTGVNNINNDGVTTGKDTVGKAHFLIGFDGLYHLPYVDNTAQRTRVQGALANTTYNNLALKLGRYAAPTRRGDVVYIAPVNVVLKTLQLAQVETIEKYGPRATISSGELTSIYGTPLIMSEQFGLVDTTGAVRNSTTTNTTGRILMVNTTQWRVGFRRPVTFENEREASKGQTTIWVTLRIAFTERTGTRSTATHTAAAYDISSVN